jgi:hypothetical protein
VTGRDRAQRAVRLDTAHRSEPGLEPAVIGFHENVRVPLEDVPRTGHELVDDPRVGRRTVGGDLDRSRPAVERASEESVCCSAVSPRADHYVDDLAEGLLR